MRHLIISFLIATILFVFAFSIQAQSVLKINALADVELSTAGEKSHYFYNEINAEHLDLRLSMSQLNIIGEWTLNNNWILNGRLLVERDRGRSFDKVSAPQLNIQWLSNRRKVGLTIGRFINPFGALNDRQLSIDRKFISNPLAYSYYTNVSTNIGYHTDLGDIEKISVNEEFDWGSSHLYYGGYSTGFMFSWNVKPSKINWKIALVNRAVNVAKQFPDPQQIGIVSKITFRPSYFWSQAFSISHANFMESSVISEQLEDLNKYSQTLVGTDFKFGKKYFELSGELIAAFYKAPQYDALLNDYVNGTDDTPLSLKSFSAYLDFSYELKWLPGSYVAYRIDHLSFGEVSNNSDLSWDNDVLRHSFAMGYHINQYILLRAAVSRQSVDNKPWDKKQDTFRLIITAHY